MDNSRTKNPAWIYLTTLSESSSRTFGSSLTAVKRILQSKFGPKWDNHVDIAPWTEMTEEEATYLRTFIEANYAVNTGNLYLAAIRGVIKVALRLEGTSGSLGNLQRLERLLDCLYTYRGVSKPVATLLSPEVIQDLLDMPFPDNKSEREVFNKFLVAFLYGTGIRKSELVRANFEDLHEVTYGGRLGHILRVTTGKDALKTRWVLCPPFINHYLRNWILLRGSFPGSLLCKWGRESRVSGLIPQYIYDTFGWFNTLPSLKGHKVTAQDFRLSYMVTLERNHLTRLAMHRLSRCTLEGANDPALGQIVWDIDWGIREL